MPTCFITSYCLFSVLWPFHGRLHNIPPMELSSPPSATKVANANASAARAANAAAASAANAAAYAAAAAAVASAAVAAAAARAFADAGFIATGLGKGTICAAATSVFWSAMSIDAKQVEGGARAPVIAVSPLWPQPQGQPDWLRPLWQEMKAALEAEGQDWLVWTMWYGDRLHGLIHDENRELAYVRIDEALWAQGPAIVNAEIRRRIEEIKSPHGVVQLETLSRVVVTGLAAISVAEGTPPSHTRARAISDEIWR